MEHCEGFVAELWDCSIWRLWAGGKEQQGELWAVLWEDGNWSELVSQFPYHFRFPNHRLWEITNRRTRWALSLCSCLWLFKCWWTLAFGAGRYWKDAYYYILFLSVMLNWWRTDFCPLKAMLNGSRNPEQALLYSSAVSPVFGCWHSSILRHKSSKPFHHGVLMQFEIDSCLFWKCVLQKGVGMVSADFWMPEEITVQIQEKSVCFSTWVLISLSGQIIKSKCRGWSSSCRST